LHYSAFAAGPSGGNPAGVVLDARDMDDAARLAMAADLGYSESAFLVPRAEPGHYDIRYWSPQAEVPFCGHATIASGGALADAGVTGPVVLHTVSGPVTLETAVDAAGHTTATLTSVEPAVTEAEPALVDDALAALGWSEAELDPALPPRVAYAGARHLVLAAAGPERLANLDYDFDALRALMLDADLITVDLIWRQDATTFRARNPFPVGGVVEDPATGAAAAALGAYLRELGAVTPPVRVRVLQGHDIGRPSELLVDVQGPDDPRLRVTGAAVPVSG
jgi:PhzF family phenazine biosynthesis protein